VHFQVDWFDHQTTRRAPLRFLDFYSLYILLLITSTQLPSLFAILSTSTMSSSTSPPSKQSMDKVAEMMSSIQQQMQLLNPHKEAGEGLHLHFTAAAEEEPFFLGNPSPSLGYGMGMAAAAPEKEVGASGLPGDTKMPDVVSLVLIFTQNERDYCCGFIGQDRVCLMKSHLCDVAKHEREKLSVVEPVLLILAPASKAMRFVAYREPSLPTSNLNQVQYETLLQ
jgi:hypothetical protein